MLSPFLNLKGPLGYLGWFLSGICHQLPEHTLMFAGQQLPLCARCTGMYLGALAGLVLQARRAPRASLLPRARVLLLMVVGALAWIADGVNSYVHFLTGSALLYTPENALRLATGVWMGLFISIVVYPMLNLTLWQFPRAYRAISAWRDVATLLLTGAAVTILSLQHWGPLGYVLWIGITISVLAVLSCVNGMIVVILTRRENSAHHIRQAAAPVLAGLLLSLVEVGGIAVLRHLAARVFPWFIPPIVPGV